MRIAFVLVAAASLTAQTLPSQQPARRPPAAAPRPAAAPSAPSYKDLKFAPPAPVEFPKPEQVTLPNGLRVYLLEDHSLPVIHGLAEVRTGRLFDPPDKAGLAFVTGQLIRSGGGGSRSATQIDEELPMLGARIDARVTETSASLSFQGLKAEIAGVLEIYRDVLTKPQFDADQLEAVRTLARASIAARNNDPKQIARRELGAALFGPATPYGARPEYDSISSIRRRDVQTFYTRYFFPKNTVLAVWGDFETAQMKADITRLFAEWTADQPAVPAFPAATAAEPATFLGVRKEVKELVFSMGLLGSKLNDKDYPALAIAAAILGHGEESRLGRKFHGQNDFGETIAAAADWGAELDTPGVFQISGVLPPLTGVATLKAVEDEAGRLRNGEVSDQELAVAKTAVDATLAFAFDTRGKAMTTFLNYEAAGYPRDYVAQLQKAFAAVTKADVLRVAKQYIDPARFTLVVIGNPSQFVEELSALGRKVTPLDLTIREETVKPVVESNESIAAGKHILAEAQAAAGGLPALTAVKDYTEVSQIHLATGGPALDGLVQWAAPNFLREEEDTVEGRVTTFTDGEVGWVALRQRSAALGGSELKKLRADLFRFYISLLISDTVKGRKIVARDEGSVDISDESGNLVHADFDPTTKLLHRLSYISYTSSGEPQPVTETYSDYRDVNGIKVAFKTTAEIAGHKYADATIREAKVNSGLKPDELRKRP